MAHVPERTTLLLVEDDAADSEAIRRALITAGYDTDRIQSHSQGRAALEACAQTMPDCIVLDYRLPDLDGLAFLTFLATAPRQLPTAVVVMTGQGSEKTAVEAMKLGVHDYLVKHEISPENLRRTIDGAIARRAIEVGVGRRIENLSTFVNAIVHDLRTPLTGVGLNIDLLEMALHSGDFDEARSAGEAVGTSYRELLGLLESLYRLVTAEGDVFDKVFFNLSSPVATARDRLRPLFEERGVQIDIQPLPDVVSDAPVIAEVVQNVLQNAARFADPDKPRITVRALIDRRVPGAPHVGLAIDDNGPGIDEGTRASMFEPLWRADAQQEADGSYLERGTGLGLAISSRLMERLGGRIRAGNNPQGGARLMLLLPVARIGSAATPPGAIELLDEH